MRRQPEGRQRVLEIRMLGEFSIKNGDADISDTINRSKRLRALFSYLIVHSDREVSQDELIEVLWPDEEIENPANTLKTILHRARSTVAALGVENAHAYLSYRRGAYAWTPEEPCFVDVKEFEALCNEAERMSDGAKKAELYEKAVELYKGNFLPKYALDNWVVPLFSFYRTKFTTAVHEAAEYLSSVGRHDRIIPLCQHGIIIDPYEEYFHQSLILAYVATGHQQQALEHYDYVTALFFNKFGVNPSQELTALYREVVKSSKKTESNLRVIIDDLREERVDKGCFYCDYEPFRTIYQLEARAAARSGQVVYVCLVTLSSSQGAQPKSKVLTKTMGKLYNTITSSLRHGDLFTRYSVNQYLVMLPATSFETSERVMKRIADTFRRENAKSPAILTYTLHPVIPTELDDGRTDGDDSLVSGAV